MVEMRCYYPDGSYAECRYAMPLKDAVELYDPLWDYDGRTIDTSTPRPTEDEYSPAFDEWDGPTLGGEG